MCDRTRAEFELWIEEGVVYLSKIRLKERTNIYFEECQQLNDTSSDKKEAILSKVKKDISHLYFKNISSIIINNLEIIYAANPGIIPEDAIKIAFTNGVIKDCYSEADLQLALLACFRTRS